MPEASSAISDSVTVASEWIKSTHLTSTILGVLAGGLATFLCTIVVDWMRRRRLSRDFKRVLCKELELVRYRLAHAIFVVAPVGGRLEQNLLKSIEPIITTYESEILSTAEREANKLFVNLLSLGDEELRKYARLKGTEEKAKNLKSICIPFLAANIHSISSVSSDGQPLLIESVTLISGINELIEQINSTIVQTFDESLSQENRRRLDTNLILFYGTFVDQGQRLLRAISNSLAFLGN